MWICPMVRDSICAVRSRVIPDLAFLPVVFCTGRDTPEDRQIAAQVGGVDYLVKPFDLREFAECLRRHLP